MRVRVLKPKGGPSKRIGSAEGLGADEGDETGKGNGVAWTQLIWRWLFFIPLCLGPLKTVILGFISMMYSNDQLSKALCDCS